MTPHHRRLTSAFLVVLLFGVPACRPHEAAVEAGCSLHEPGRDAAPGVAAFTRHVTPTPDGFGVGSLAIALTCGTERDLVTFVLPNQRRGVEVRGGVYRVAPAGDTADARNPRLAWASWTPLELPEDARSAVGGTLLLQEATPDRLVGTFRIVFAGDSIALPRLLGGAFRATYREGRR